MFNLIYYSNDRPFNGALDYIYVILIQMKYIVFTVKGETIGSIGMIIDGEKMSPKGP